MTRVSCFSGILAGKKKKSKDSIKPAEAKRIHSIGDLPVKPDEFYYSNAEKEMKEVQDTEKSPSTKMENENSLKTELSFEAAYEGGDEHDDNFSFKREFSDFDLQALEAQCNELKIHDLNQESNSNVIENKLGSSRGITPDAIQSGHLSDPGMGRTTAFWGSPTLKRSCSNIETKRSSVLLKAPGKSSSCDDLQNYSGNVSFELTQPVFGSPLSVITSCSADKVMLKKRSSSQVLPSRSKKLWWRLFLWSHRNLHKTGTSYTQKIVDKVNKSNQKGGYCSDTVEASCGVDKKKKKAIEEPEIVSESIWPQNQWVAFSAESSSLDRVGAWVHSLDPFFPIDEDEDVPLGNPDEPFCSMEIGECSNKNNKNNGRRIMEEFAEANTIIQSLSSLSSVAHIAGMGLKVIPPIASFTSLRSVNLSGNFIVNITPGSLPKSLHTLDLSRNKIATVEGLRELTKLRVLNLSYNRISRLGHGLSNCTVIKQLYLAGNKISDVEGLHRLLKLTVLDLSFNKITTAKALGQLVANYNSLLALNLLGNPIQSNIGDEQLRKAVCGLLPSLAYLNKQPIKPQRAREVATDSVAKAALGGSSRSSRRNLGRRSSQGSTGSVKGGTRRGSSSVALMENGKHKSKGRHQYSSSRK